MVTLLGSGSAAAQQASAPVPAAQDQVTQKVIVSGSRQSVMSYYRSAGFNWRRGDWDAEGLIAKTNSNYANDTNIITLTQKRLA